MTNMRKPNRIILSLIVALTASASTANVNALPMAFCDDTCGGTPESMYHWCMDMCVAGDDGGGLGGDETWTWYGGYYDCNGVPTEPEDADPSCTYVGELIVVEGESTGTWPPPGQGGGGGSGGEDGTGGWEGGSDPGDFYCGDGTCSKWADEDEETCPNDCREEPVCGDDSCDDGETPDNCPQDCDLFDAGSPCGDQFCGGGENGNNCPIDCGFCGDDICQGDIGENATTCNEDCAPFFGYIYHHDQIGRIVVAAASWGYYDTDRDGILNAHDPDQSDIAIGYLVLLASYDNVYHAAFGPRALEIQLYVPAP